MHLEPVSESPHSQPRCTACSDTRCCDGIRKEAKSASVVRLSSPCDVPPGIRLERAEDAVVQRPQQMLSGRAG
jgi:hypothetical protein